MIKLLIVLGVFVSLSSSAKTDYKKLAEERFEELQTLNNERSIEERTEDFFNFVSKKFPKYKVDRNTHDKDYPTKHYNTILQTVFAYSANGGMCKFKHYLNAGMALVNSECYDGDGNVYSSSSLFEVDF